MRRRVLFYVPLLGMLCLTILLCRGLFLDPHDLPSVQIDKPLPEFELRDFNASLAFSNHTLKNKWTLLNVFSSWCMACAEEQPFLEKLAKDGIAIYGLNYKDNDKEAKQWLEQQGNPYQAVGVDKIGNVAMDLGVYGAPETFLIDPNGIIRVRYAGPLDAVIWKEFFMSKMT